jgi:ankyrin repeat protein
VNTLLYKAPKQGIREATLLMIACIYRSDDVVTTLLELGADVNAKDEKRNTALIHLLQYPREYEEPETNEEYDEVIGNVLNIVKILIEKGADAAAENNKGINPLILMASRDYDSEIDLDVVDELLKAGAEILSTTDEGKNAYMVAIDYDRSDIIWMFLQARPTIDLNDTETFPPDGALWYLLKAQRERSSNILRVFLNAQEPIDLNKFSKAEDGLTPLTYAILAQMFDVAQELVEAGADVNLPDEDNQFTPLMLSTQADIEFLGFLIDKGADINKQVGRNNNSAIFEFIESKVPVEKFKFLI